MIGKRNLGYGIAGICAAVLLLASPTAGAQASGKVTVLLNTTGESLKAALLKSVSPNALVAISDIYSLKLTVTNIALRQENVEDDNEDADKHGGHGPGSGGDFVSVFSGAEDVDLVTLVGMPKVFSSADIPAGTYSKVCITVTNPRLRLVADPNTEITTVKICANGRLFIDQTFDVPADQNSLIELTLNDIHLVRTGSGHGGHHRGGPGHGPGEGPGHGPGHGPGGTPGVRYVLNPQLDATITVSSADVTSQGAVASVDVDADTLVVTLAEGDVTVNYAGAAIFLPTDTDTATGTEADLVVGATIEVVGTIDVDGVITATEIHVL